MAHSTNRCTGILLVVIIINLVDSLIPIQLFNGQDVACLVLQTAWWSNLCSKMITTVPRETFTGALNLSGGGSLRIGAKDLIPEGTGIVPPPNVPWVEGLVKHLPPI